jgi:Tol biopolymer transport system component
MSRNALAAVAAGAALAGAAASPAMADSIVYVKNHNVWVMAPDGSKQRQVTRDGTAAAPYVSPSQADNGRIAAGKGYAIVVVDRKGKRLSRFVPRNLKDSTGHSTAGQPTRLALSPDAKRIAYMLTSQSCDLTIDCCVRATIANLAANRKSALIQPCT